MHQSTTRDHIVMDTFKTIKTFPPYDGNEVIAKASTLAFLLEFGTHAFDRSNAYGHIVASGFVVSHDFKKMVLLKHKKLNMLLQPGGHVELTDNQLIDAAMREVTEELSIPASDLWKAFDGAPFDLELQVYPKKNDVEKHWHLDVRFCFITRNMNIHKSDESDTCGWFELDDPNFIIANDIVLTKRIIDKIRMLSQQ